MLLFKKYLQEKYLVTDRDWEIISEFAEPIQVAKNEYVIKKGKICRRLLFVCEGVFRYCMERDGKDITCYFVSENYLL